MYKLLTFLAYTYIHRSVLLKRNSSIEYHESGTYTRSGGGGGGGGEVVRQLVKIFSITEMSLYMIVCYS